ncbi:MAG: hypothetical protein ACK2UW_17635, partial [Anaerolineales bacterium]
REWMMHGCLLQFAQAAMPRVLYQGAFELYEHCLPQHRWRHPDEWCGRLFRSRIVGVAIAGIYFLRELQHLFGWLSTWKTPTQSRQVCFSHSAGRV